MSNNQSTQPSPQLSKQKPPSRRNRQFELLRNHPWLLLVVVGALLAAISALAISSLVSIGGVSGDNPAQTTINTDEATQFSEPAETKSINWLLAIVIFGAGGVVIYRRIKTSGMPNFSWRAARGRLTRRQQRKLLLQQSKAAAFAVEPQPVAIIKPPITEAVATEDIDSSHNLESQIIVLPQEEIAVDADLNSLVEPEVITGSLDSNPEETVVTILPPEKEEPIDPRTRSLAEMMDIRKHLSLYAILHDFHPKK